MLVHFIRCIKPPSCIQSRVYHRRNFVQYSPFDLTYNGHRVGTDTDCLPNPHFTVVHPVFKMLLRGKLRDIIREAEKKASVDVKNSPPADMDFFTYLKEYVDKTKPDVITGLEEEEEDDLFIAMRVTRKVISPRSFGSRFGQSRLNLLWARREPMRSLHCWELASMSKRRAKSITRSLTRRGASSSYTTRTSWIAPPGKQQSYLR